MDARTQVKKFDYAEQYDREEYADKSDILTFDRQGIKLTHDGTPILKEAVHKKGRPKILCLQEIEAWGAERILGVMCALDGNDDTEFEYK